MKTKYDHTFFEEHDDNRGAAAIDIDPPKPKGEEGVEGAAPPPPEPPPPPTVDAKELAKEFGEALKDLVPAKKEEQPPLSPEEAKRLLNVWDPTEDWIKRFDNLETRAAAIQEMRDGLIRQGDTITQHRLRELRTAIEEKLTPALEMVEEMQNRQRDERFDATYPQLAKPTLKPLIETVAQRFVDVGKKFKNETEMFDAIASDVETIIKETNPDFKLEKASGSIPARPKTAAGGIPVTSPGAGGGTGTTTGGKEPPKKRGLAVFE